MKRFILPALFFGLAASSAPAVTLDFTGVSDTGGTAIGSTYSDTWSGVGVTLKARPRSNSFTHAANTDLAGGALAECQAQGLECTYDGIGLNDDEITSPWGEERLKLVFDTVQNVTGIHLLDLYINGPAGTQERATVFFRDSLGQQIGPAIDILANPNGSPSGYQYAGNLPYHGVKSILFSANSGIICNDGDCLDDSTNDFALAAIEVTPVPLPAAGFLLLGGLAALSTLRRKRRFD